MGELGIPERAVDFVVQGYSTLLGDGEGLEDEWRPLVGGIQHQQEAYGIKCTVGFGTERDSVEGIVLASHCTLALH